MVTSTTCLRLAAMLCGAALVASQVIQNLEHMGWVNAFSGLGLAAVAVPIAMAVAVPVMQHNWTGGSYGSAGLAFLVLVCGIAHTMIVALERGAHVRDVRAAATSNIAHDLAKKAHDGATARVRELERLVTAEGKTGCRKACEAAKADLEDARRQALGTQSALVQVGAPVDRDGMSKRYGHLAHLIDIWHPLVLPLAMELGAMVLIGFAFHRGKAAPASQAVPAPGAVTKVDEAAEAIRRLRESQGGKIGSIRAVSQQIGHSHGTTQRAFRLAGS